MDRFNRKVYKALDTVIEASGFDHAGDILQQLLTLDLQVAKLEAQSKQVQSPGLPEWAEERYLGDTCMKVEPSDR